MGYFDAFCESKNALMAYSNKPYKGELTCWQLVPGYRIKGILLPSDGSGSKVWITSQIKTIREGLLETENSLYGLT